MTAMAVAALYDIHGNLPALEAVLADVRRLSVDAIVVGGDVFPGPQSKECLDCLLGFDLPVRFLRGNGERAVLSVAHGGEADSLPQQVRESVRWLARRLAPERVEAMASWPPSVRLAIDGIGDVLFTRLTPAERIADAFAQADAPLVVCGHTHMQFDRHIGPTRVVNAGSVGMPFGEPGAYWLLLGDGVALRRTAYDLEDAAARVRASEHPQAADFAAHNILQPPSEREMLELFGGAPAANAATTGDTPSDGSYG